MEQNLKNDILRLAEGEKIEAVVIGRLECVEYLDKPIPHYNETLKGKILSWDEAEKTLDYEYYEMEDYCLPVYVWTHTKIILLAKHDGNVWLYTVPRHPIAVEPKIEGC